MKIFTTISSCILISAIFLSASNAKAREIDEKVFCKVTIQESENDQYDIWVPRDKVEKYQEVLNVVGVNCRNES